MPCVCVLTFWGELILRCTQGLLFLYLVVVIVPIVRCIGVVGDSLDMGKKMLFFHCFVSPYLYLPDSLLSLLIVGFKP